jgi:hypothetical protein
MNNEQLQTCWDELKHSACETPNANLQLEKNLMMELTTLGPRRRFRKRALTVVFCLFGICILGGVIADNISVASSIEQTDGLQEERSESLLNYVLRHVHAHAGQIHRHFHGE